MILAVISAHSITLLLLALALLREQRHWRREWHRIQLELQFQGHVIAALNRFVLARYGINADDEKNTLNPKREVHPCSTSSPRTCRRSSSA